MIVSHHVTIIADKNVRVTMDNRAQTGGFDGRQLEVLIVNHRTLDSWTWRVYEIIKAVSDRTHWRMIKDFTSSAIPALKSFLQRKKQQLVPYLVEDSQAKLAQIHAELRINSYTCPAMDFFLNYRICLEVQLEAMIIKT